MKRTTLLMLALLCSAVMLLAEAINADPLAGDATRLVCCKDLPDCGGNGCCIGRAIPDSCTILCDDGSLIFCRDDLDVE